MFLIIVMLSGLLQIDAQEYYEVKVEQIDVMNAPTLEGQIIGQLKKHSLVEVIKTTNGWATINYAGAHGFILLSGLRTLGSDEDVSPASNSVIEETPSSPKLGGEGQVTLKAGTIIPIQLVKNTRASQVHVGDQIAFRVAQEIIVDGVVVIPFGTPVMGTVYEAKKSKWWGTKGRLGIRIDGIVSPDGIQIPITDGNFYVTGKNRTALTVVLFLFCAWPCCFICGTKAEAQAGQQIIARTTMDVQIPLADRVRTIDFGKQTVQSHKQIADSMQSDTQPTKSFPFESDIVLWDGTVIPAIIYSIEDKIIKYRKQSRPNGQMLEINTSEVINQIMQ